jgi:outer membrane protein assembly factor BamB
MIHSTPAVANGMVYIGSEDGNLYALSEKDGSLKWKYKTDGMVSTPAVANDMVYFGSHDFNVYALRCS